jgi:hypothetical protein
MPVTRRKSFVGDMEGKGVVLAERGGNSRLRGISLKGNPGLSLFGARVLEIPPVPHRHGQVFADGTIDLITSQVYRPAITDFIKKTDHAADIEAPFAERLNEPVPIRLSRRERVAAIDLDQFPAGTVGA